MDINKLLKNNESLKEVIDMKELEYLQKRVHEIIHPYEILELEIIKRKKYLKETERLKIREQRTIKNFPQLNSLITQLGDEYKQTIIDIDELLVTIAKNKYFTENNLVDILRSNKLKANCIMTGFKEILKFLTDNNIIMKQYVFECPHCDDFILLFKGNYEKNEIIDILRKKYENDVCSHCGEKIVTDINQLYLNIFSYMYIKYGKRSVGKYEY